jgi:outer membrane protein
MRHFLLTILSIAILQSVSAQTIWSLEKAVQVAAQNSIGAQISAIGIDQMEVSKKQANHSRYPSLNANGGAQWNFGRTIDPTTNEFNTETFFSNNWSLSTGVTLYNGGKINKSIKQSDLMVKAAEQDYQQQIRNISLQVANTYLSAIFALENRKISENQLKLSEDQLDQINIMIKNGSLPANEALEIQAQIARESQNIILNENSYQASLLTLKQLLRLDPQEHIALEVPNLENLETTNPFSISFDEAYKLAVQNQPSIKAGELKIKSSQIGRSIAAADQLPSLRLFGSLGTNYSNRGINILGNNEVEVVQDVKIDDIPAKLAFDQSFPIVEDANYSDQIDNNLSYGFGFGLSIPLYNNYAVKGQKQRADLDIQQTMLNNDQIREDLKINVQSALAESRSAKLALEASEKALTSQKAAFANAQKRFKLGAINNFDYITSRNLIDNAEINTLISKYDYIFKLKVLEFYMGKAITLN